MDGLPVFSLPNIVTSVLDPFEPHSDSPTSTPSTISNTPVTSSTSLPPTSSSQQASSELPDTTIENVSISTTRDASSGPIITSTQAGSDTPATPTTVFVPSTETLKTSLIIFGPSRSTIVSITIHDQPTMQPVTRAGAATSKRAIVGGAVGALMGGAIVLTAIYFLCRRRQRRPRLCECNSVADANPHGPGSSQSDGAGAIGREQSSFTEYGQCSGPQSFRVIKTRLTV